MLTSLMALARLSTFPILIFQKMRLFFLAHGFNDLTSTSVQNVPFLVVLIGTHAYTRISFSASCCGQLLSYSFVFGASPCACTSSLFVVRCVCCCRLSCFFSVWNVVQHSNVLRFSRIHCSRCVKKRRKLRKVLCVGSDNLCCDSSAVNEAHMASPRKCARVYRGCPAREAWKYECLPSEPRSTGYPPHARQ